MASGIVSYLSWCQELQQKCAKLSAVIRSKLFLHEYENEETVDNEAALSMSSAMFIPL